MMAYSMYRPVPKNITVPDNLMIMVAINGPWAESLPYFRNRDEKLVKDWVKKCHGKKTWLWNYANKAGPRQIPGLPAITPRAIGTYYKRLAPLIFGAYMQSDTDNYIYNHLNFYVFSRICWDNQVDVDAVLKEYYQLMYGPAAPVMEKIFQRFEDLWINKIVAKPIDTPLGPECVPPSDDQIWEEIYSPAELAAIGKQFDKAEKLTAKDKKSLSRVKFMRREFFGPLLATAEKYQKSKQELNNLKLAIKKLPTGKKPVIDGKLNDAAWKNSNKVFLIPFNGTDGRIHTTVKALVGKKYLYFGFECEEPMMNKIIATKNHPNDPSIWKESEVEIFLNPSGDRKNYYQWLINAEGSMVDIKCKNIGAKHLGDIKWNSKAKVATYKAKDRWFAEIAIPISSLPGFKTAGFPANFNRHRMVDSSKKYQKLFTWSPFLRTGFHDLQNFGSLVFGDIKDNSIINNGAFSSKPGKRSLGKWLAPSSKYLKPGQSWSLDKTTYRVGGQCLRMTNKTAGKKTRIFFTQILPGLKPNTKYRLSFFIKTKDIAPTGKKGRGGAVVNIMDDQNRWYPTRNWYKGTTPWKKQGFEFTTGPYTNDFSKSGVRKGKKNRSYMRVCLSFCTGTVWFDDLKLQEVK